MANPSNTLLSPAELREQLTSGLDEVSGAEVHEEFSSRLDNFLEQNDITEFEIISGESEYVAVLSEAAFNGLDFRGMEGTGLSLADARRMMNDPVYRLEMAEDYLTRKAESRIEAEYSEIIDNPQFPLGPPIVLPMSAEGIEPFEEAVKTKEFMHYEMRHALNSGPKGAPATLNDFEQDDFRYEWMEMGGDQAAFHQNGGADDLKFIHPDGRELVYDGDTNELMTDDRYMGTYNYANATIPNDATPGPIEAFLNTRTEGSKLHKAYDVDTWIELGNSRADRDAHGGADARQEQMNSAIGEGFKNSVRNTRDETQENIRDAQDWVSDKADQAGDAINDTFEDIKGGLWQEGALNPSHQNINGAHIQRASLSNTAMPTGSGTIALEDAITMLSADQKALNASTTGEQTSTVKEALNHPDAVEMFQNLHTYGVETLTADITPNMSPEDRASELLLAGQEATQQADIPMPEEQRELEAARELNHSYENNNYEDDYSMGL